MWASTAPKPPPPPPQKKKKKKVAMIGRPWLRVPKVVPYIHLCTVQGSQSDGMQ